MIITGKFTVTIDDDGSEVVWVSMKSTGATEARLIQRGMGETEGTMHKAVKDCMRTFRALNNLRADEMSRAENHYAPEQDPNGEPWPEGMASR